MATGLRPQMQNKQKRLIGKEKLLFLNVNFEGTEPTWEKPFWSLLAGQISDSMSFTADAIDVGSKETGGWGQSRPGIKSSELSIECIAIADSPVLKEFKNSFVKEDENEALDILRWQIDGSADRNWYVVTEYTEETAQDGALTINMTLSGLGEPRFIDNMEDPRKPATPAPMAAKAKTTA